LILITFAWDKKGQYPKRKEDGKGTPFWRETINSQRGYARESHPSQKKAEEKILELKDTYLDSGQSSREILFRQLM